jgi:hypothetical protein
MRMQHLKVSLFPAQAKAGDAHGLVAVGAGGSCCICEWLFLGLRTFQWCAHSSTRHVSSKFLTPCIRMRIDPDTIEAGQPHVGISKARPPHRSSAA